MASTALYNCVQLRYVDTRGLTRVIKRKWNVPALDDAGEIRAAWVDLSGEVGTLAEAERIADQVLQGHR